jgi:hypothetical protein
MIPLFTSDGVAQISMITTTCINDPCLDIGNGLWKYMHMKIIVQLLGAFTHGQSDHTGSSKYLYHHQSTSTSVTLPSKPHGKSHQYHRLLVQFQSLQLQKAHQQSLHNLSVVDAPKHDLAGDLFKLLNIEDPTPSSTEHPLKKKINHGQNFNPLKQ